MLNDQHQSGDGGPASASRDAGVVDASMDGQNLVGLVDSDTSRADANRFRYRLLKRMLKSNKDIIGAKISVFKRDIDAADDDLLDMRDKKTADSQGQNRSDDSCQGSLGSKYAPLVHQKKKILKQKAGRNLKDIFIITEAGAEKSIRGAKAANREAEGAQSSKHWIFHMYRSNKAEGKQGSSASGTLGTSLLQ